MLGGQELFDLRPRDQQTGPTGPSATASQGGKRRYCLLWKVTATILREYKRTREVDPSDAQPLFHNHCGQPLPRFGMRYILAKHAGTAKTMPTLEAKRVHLYVLRHTAAWHYLSAWRGHGHDRDRLGNASVSTSSIHAAVDLQSILEPVRKAKALQDADPSFGDWLAHQRRSPELDREPVSLRRRPRAIWSSLPLEFSFRRCLPTTLHTTGVCTV